MVCEAVARDDRVWGMTEELEGLDVRLSRVLALGDSAFV